MIYGNPLIFGGSGGGSGPSASDAILTVTVPTGSTVTATKGGTTLTPTMWVQAADNTRDCALFVIGPSLFDSVNAWMVTATLSGHTASGTVTIDSNEQYDLYLDFELILLNLGDNWTDNWMTRGTYTVTVQADGFVVSRGGSGEYLGFSTKTTYDTTEYTAAKALYSYCNNSDQFFAVMDSPTTYISLTTIPISNRDNIVSADLHTINGNCYFALALDGNTYVKVKKIWLEK